MADPYCLPVVVADAEAFDRVGMPEGQFFLSHAALYITSCKKTNTAYAYYDALDFVQKEKQYDVPSHLKDASRDKESFGHGEGYKYPHAFKDHWVAQQYLPSSLKGKVFYTGAVRKDCAVILRKMPGIMLCVTIWPQHLHSSTQEMASTSILPRSFWTTSHSWNITAGIPTASILLWLATFTMAVQSTPRQTA